LSRWVTGLAERRRPNVAAIARANKTVRMAWAMMNHNADYDPDTDQIAVQPKVSMLKLVNCEMAQTTHSPVYF
jgi:hypothetical protein